MMTPPISLSSRIAGAIAVTALGAALVATALTAIPADATTEVLASIALPH